MLELKVVDFLTVQKFFVDFQKHSKCFELPPEVTEYIGVYDQSKLIGYFALVAYNDGDLEVNQGYLVKDARHIKNLSQQCMQLLEQKAKEIGFKKIVLQTQSRFRSYLKFMSGMGYKPNRLIFSKEI